MPSDLSDLLDSIDNEGSGDGQKPKGGGLRAQLEAVLADRAAMAEQLKQLQEGQRSRDLADVFKEHAIPEGFRDFFPKEGDPRTAAADFVTKYGALWGSQPQAATTPVGDQAAAGAMQQVAAQAGAVPLAPLSEEAYAAKFAEAQTKEQFMQMLAELSASA